MDEKDNAEDMWILEAAYSTRMFAKEIRRGNG
jgi:hypothetical protein